MNASFGSICPRLSPFMAAFLVVALINDLGCVEKIPDASDLLSSWVAKALVGDPVASDIAKRFGAEGARIVNHQISRESDPNRLKIGKALLEQMCAIPRAMPGAEYHLPIVIGVRPVKYIGFEIIEGQEEFRVWQNSQPRRLRRQSMDPVSGLTYINVTATGFFVGSTGRRSGAGIIRGLAIASVAASQTINLDVVCDMDIGKYLTENQITDALLTQRIVEIQRGGQNVTIRCVMPGKAGEPDQIVEQIDLTGGGFSRLDMDPNATQLWDTLAAGDDLSVRRYLQRMLIGMMPTQLDGIEKLININKPMTAYWATRVLAKYGKSAGVAVRMAEIMKQANAPSFASVIACYRGLIDDQSDKSMDVVLDPVLFETMCSTFNQFSGELVPDLIGECLSVEEQRKFRNALVSWDGPINSQMRMMAWILSKCPGRENVDALILLHERSKDEEIAKLTERLLSMTVAAPSSLDEAKRGGLDANSIAEIETRWFNNAKEVTRWWRVNRESLVWDSWDGMYRLAKASGK